MIFLSGHWQLAVADLFRDGTLGLMCRPGNSYRPDAAQVWAADSGCFGDGYPGDDAYLAWLEHRSAHRGRCLFATAPDVVGDEHATLQRSAALLPAIRQLGYKAAFVAQNGAETTRIPWSDFDALFVGGVKECSRCGWRCPVSDGKRRICAHCAAGLAEWKLSPAAAELSRQAHDRGKWVHIGRVNFARRMAHVRGFDAVDSIDGTRLVFGVDKNLPQLLEALADRQHQGLLI